MLKAKRGKRLGWGLPHSRYSSSGPPRPASVGHSAPLPSAYAPVLVRGPGRVRVRSGLGSLIWDVSAKLVHDYDKKSEAALAASEYKN